MQPDELVDDVERALLGGLLVAHPPELPPLRAEEFFLERHRLIWRTLAQHRDTTGRVADLVGLHADLRQAGELDAVGGPAYLAQLVDEGALALDLDGYARRIRGAATSRALRAMGLALAAEGLSTAEVERRLAAIPPTLRAESVSGRALWEQIQVGWLDVPLLLGLSQIDQRLRMLPGDLVVVGGRTSQGKTSLLVSTALRLVAAGVSVAYYSLEVPATAVWRRLVAAHARVSLSALRYGNLGATEFQLADETSAWLADRPLWIYDTGHLGGKEADRLLDVLRSERAQVIMVDHAQELLTPGESRARDLGEVMGRLKERALLGPHVVVVAAQLSRQTERHRGLPVLADLKESGGLEERADAVLLLHHWRSAGDTDHADEDLAILVAKNRDGETGLVSARFVRRFGLVEAVPP